MGVGIGLTFDEAALLLDLRDVYWTREGLLSVQLSLGATAILSIAILTGRMLRRGERAPGGRGPDPRGRPSRHVVNLVQSISPQLRGRGLRRGTAFGLLARGPGEVGSAAGEP